MNAEQSLEPTKDLMERVVELVKEDKELHDAILRLINATAEEKEIQNARRKKR